MQILRVDVASLLGFKVQQLDDIPGSRVPPILCLIPSQKQELCYRMPLQRKSRFLFFGGHNVTDPMPAAHIQNDRVP